MTRYALPLMALVACDNKKSWETGWPSEDSGGGDDLADADGDSWTVAAGDCDDNNPDVNPGTYEIGCDGLDNDCVGGDSIDQDSDGFECQEVGGDDCDDLDNTVYPNAPDTCGDGIDNNCDGDSECDCDGDGYDGDQCSGGDDCDDDDDTINPGIDDECYDGVDADCSGNDDYDCDNDGYASDAHGGTDCNDLLSSIGPGEVEVCMDEIDNDCDASTSDCDCDLDGVDGSEGTCEGDDCDDEDAAIYPGADDIADGTDNDCDADVDEDGYCHTWYPTTNGRSATREYTSTAPDGNVYDETVVIESWDSSTGEASLGRTYSGSSGSYDVTQDIVCDEDGISTTSWAVGMSFISLTPTFTTPRVDMLPEDELYEGSSWDFSYDAEDSMLGSVWTAEGTMTVVGTDTITVDAGTFDVIVIENQYSLIDNTGFMGLSRDGTATYFYAQYLGLVYMSDTDTAGTLVEERELTSYSGFYPDI